MFMMKFTDEAIRNGESEDTLFLLSGSPYFALDLFVWECQITKAGIVHPKSPYMLPPESFNLSSESFEEFLNEIQYDTQDHGDHRICSSALPMNKPNSWFFDSKLEFVRTAEIIELYQKLRKS